MAMARNRLVAALAEFLVIIESEPRQQTSNKDKKLLSLAYNCAEQAKKIGRPVYVLTIQAKGNKDLKNSNIATEYKGPPRAATRLEATPSASQTPSESHGDGGQSKDAPSDNGIQGRLL